jgi:hypothetical protein
MLLLDSIFVCPFGDLIYKEFTMESLILAQDER